MRETQMDRRSRGGAAEPCVEISYDGPVLVLGGDLDVRSTGEVRTAIYHHLGVHGDIPGGQVVVDITGVQSADATALKMLAAATRQAQRYGVRVVLRGATPAVRRMLHLTHLIRLVELEREPVPA
jgi:anti-anti-sigma factor